MGNDCSASNTSGSEPSNKKSGAKLKDLQNEARKAHKVCRGGTYPKTDDILRFPVPDDKADWSVDFPDYEPFEFFAIHDVPLDEDPDFRTDKSAKVKWNDKDETVNRKSHMGRYQVVDGVARNPNGRTGIVGRGRLARWGPNHAADPLVSRWKRDKEGSIVTHPSSGLKVLQFVCIKRGDSGQWALPGGFVDCGEEAQSALKREFGEEALNSEEASEEEKKVMQQKLEQLFRKGTEVYRGYVDDPRNTDQAWMETLVVNVHDDTGEGVGKFNLQAGDDAVGVQWQDISCDLDLYASHELYVHMATILHGAHW